MRPLFGVRPPRPHLEHKQLPTTPNKYTVLADFPQLPPPTPIKKESSPGTSKQTINSYAKRSITTYSEAVQPPPLLEDKPSSSSSIEQEKRFEWINSQQVPIIAIESKLADKNITEIIKSCYSERNYVETDYPFKTRNYYEAILIATESIEIEHDLKDKNDPTSIRYSKFTIKKILSPADWPVDHLHTPIPFPVPVEFRMPVYNYYDYKAAWFNFMYLRPTTHSWFVKVCEKTANTPIPRWFYEWWGIFGADERVLSTPFKQLHLKFKQENEQSLSMLPEHIQLCKFFITKRVSYIISWEFKIEIISKVRYLIKSIKIKGWAPRERQVSTSAAPSTAAPSSSKEALKRQLQEALANIDKADTKEVKQISELLDAASSAGSAEDNGDMEDPRGMAQAYLTLMDI